MKNNTPARLDGSLTLAALADGRTLDGFDAGDLLFVECEPGWYALINAGALQELISRLPQANNTWLAGLWLNTTLAEFLRPIARQSDSPPAGPSRRPPPSTADDLLRALEVDPDALSYHSQMSERPEEAAEAAEAMDDLLNESSGGGSGEIGVSDDGGSAKGGLGGTDSDGEQTGSVRPTPPPPPPPKPALKREEIRLDVVTPETAVVNEPFDMAVAIRQPDSPALVVEDLPKLTSTRGDVYRADDQDLIKYRVEVEVDDCEVKPARYDFILAKGRDSIVQYFQLTPKRAGTLSIVVNAYQADSAVLAASTRVRLKAGVAVMTDATSTPAPADTIKLYEALTSLFQRDDVEDIAFRLNIKWDELAGDTLSAKCRSLLTYCSNRGQIDLLRQTIKLLRPQANL